VMLGASQVLRVNEHVRVDILYAWYPTRMKVVIDLLGLTFFLLPLCAFVAWSAISGGLIRWPAMLTIPLGMSLLLLQGLSEIIKRIAWLMGVFEMDTHYERPLQ
jgi:TRAP-type mannitol/chloroaromatic compound transport system permease small subunit